MDEPTRTSGPEVIRSIMASTSPRQRVMVASAKSPPEAPWPK